MAAKRKKTVFLLNYHFLPFIFFSLHHPQLPQRIDNSQAVRRHSYPSREFRIRFLSVGFIEGAKFSQQKRLRKGQFLSHNSHFSLGIVFCFVLVFVFVWGGAFLKDSSDLLKLVKRWTYTVCFLLCFVAVVFWFLLLFFLWWVICVFLSIRYF